MTYRKSYPELKRPVAHPTRFTTQVQDDVWVRVGEGWCPAIVVDVGKNKCRVHFVTGANESRFYYDLRWRRDEVAPTE